MDVLVYLTMKYIVSISGGLGSAEALKRAIEKFGKENVIAIFADVKGTGEHSYMKMPVITKLLHERYGGEHRDLYRFIWRLSYHFDIPIERIGTDESIWDVFARKRAMRLVIGKVFFCVASEELKRRAIARWIQENVKEDFTLILGMAWDEEHRVKSASHWWAKWFGRDIPVISLNGESPVATNESTALYFIQNEIEISSSYKDEFEHDNCGGGCTQAGQGHYANLYHKRPMVYYYWAWMEYMLGRYLGEYYTILKDERDGKTKRLSLTDFIPRILAKDYRKQEGIACSCFGNIYQLEDAVKTQLAIPKQISMFGDA